MRIAISALLAALLAATGEAQVVVRDGLRFERLFGTGDPVPGAPAGESIAYAVEPALSGEWIAAYAASEWSGVGYCVWHAGDLWSMVEARTQLPGVQGTILQVDLFSQSYAIGRDGLAAFFAEVSTSEQFFPGVWGWQDGELFLVAGPGTPVPDGDGAVFDAADQPVVAGGIIYCVGWWTDSDGALRGEVFAFSNATLTRTPLNSAVALGFSSLTGADDWLAAGAVLSPVTYSLMRWRIGAAAPEVIFDRSLTGQISWTGMVLAEVPDLPGYPSPPGLYRFDGPVPYLVHANDELDPQTGLPAPASGGSIDGSTVAYPTFVQNDQFRARLYVEDEQGEVRRIIGSGDELDGAEVGRLYPYRQYLDDNRLAVGIERPGDGAVWLVDLAPEGTSPLAIPALGPGALSAFALVLACCGLAWTRRKAPGAPRADDRNVMPR